jgi:AcrR family transcriptional regulator
MPMPKVVAEYKEQAKARIVDVAEGVFSQKGYHETTMEDVGKTLGVSKGALYLYFPSKEALFKAIVERWGTTMREMLLGIAKDEKEPNGLGDIVDRVLTDSQESLGLTFEFISQGSRDPSIRKILQENYIKTARSLAEFLEKKKAGHPGRNKADARSQASALIAFLIGLMGSLILGVKKGELRRTWMKSTKAMLGIRS